MEYYCNPVNIEYRYQFNQSIHMKDKIEIAREAADPSIIVFQGRYYLFASMTLCVWVSSDLVLWEEHRLPDSLPLYDYAPDVRVIGDYVYFSASKRGEPCNFYRTKDILQGTYEVIEGEFEFWDPNLFADDDGRVYFYWGCSNNTPLWGVELDSDTMKPIGEPIGLIESDVYTKGFERGGANHCIVPLEGDALEHRLLGFLQANGMNKELLSEEMITMIRGYISNMPYIEGAWMDKFHGKYYLQYGCNGTQYNVYADGVYVGDHPLGPFTLAKNNPYSYKPGGFIPGAGHGSTLVDFQNGMWHASTMRISKNHMFERRIGLWPAGIDEEGELFCNQRYGDWPYHVSNTRQNPWANPEWYLLSYQKKMSASSYVEGKEAIYAVDENVQTWWQAANNTPGEWIQIDLGQVYDVRAVQINFADDRIMMQVPGVIRGTTQARYIEERKLRTRWLLEGSVDGKDFEILENKSEVETDYTHDLVVKGEGKFLRYLKLTVIEVPYDQKPCVSGFRVFGSGSGSLPDKVKYHVSRLSDTDMHIKIQENGATGYSILWGHDPDKLYHSAMTFEPEQQIGALVKGQNYYIRVDAFNENGITKGETIPLI